MTEEPTQAEGLIIEIDFSDIDETIADLEGFPGYLDQELTPTMELALQLLQAEVVFRTPTSDVMGSGGINIGTLGNSIGHEIISRFPDLKGVVGSPLIYAPVMEYGRRPGKKMPPVRAIKFWVVRKLQVPAEEAEGVAWAIAKHIAIYGTKGKFMFREGLKAAEPNVRALFERAVAQAISKANL